MKANEAPEKVYCESDGLGNIVKVHNIKWPDDEAENIEYTRTDAFIEKACDAYCKVCGHYLHTVPTHICRQDCRYFSDFKRYMKGE